MTERTPDIEIYLKAVTIDAIERWLATVFTVEPISSSGTSTCRYRVTLPDSPEPPADVLVVIDAVARGHYTSIWFRDNRTPWPDDLACARDARRFLDTEVRCSASGWRQGDVDPGWWCLGRDGSEQRIDWE